MRPIGPFAELLTGNILIGFEVGEELIHKASGRPFIPFLSFGQGEPFLGLGTVLEA